ncbi:MAG: hypothetical protein GX205_03540 [Firmicutes bacterium]|nr:hypothetical protein [Bacillota bacterium]
MITPTVTITLLGIVTVLIALGFGERVLERMRLNTTAAIILLLAMVGAHFLPELAVFPDFRVHLGALILSGIVTYLLTTTSAQEALRGLLVSVITGAIIWLSDKLLPIDPESSWFTIDPLFVSGIVAGLTAYVLGRSRRSAFCGAILGLLFVDIANIIELSRLGTGQTLEIGGGGLLAAMALNPLIAVGIAEIIGEIRERLHRDKVLTSGSDDNE